MTEAFATLAFDPATYATDLRLAGNAFRNADGKGDTFARSALTAIVTDAMGPLSIALSVYDEMAPLTAKGKLAEPKESDKAPGGVSVSTLRSAVGGNGARVTLEAVFYIADNAALDSASVAAFIRNDKGAMKLFPLKAHLAKVKLDAAKADADAAKGDDADLPEKEGQEAAPVPAIVAELTAMAARIADLSGDELLAAGDALAAVMAAAKGAADRLAASDLLELQAA